MLFSEPKIPQSRKPREAQQFNVLFQCSSASRKFLNCGMPIQARPAPHVSVLFSEPKIPQSSAASTFAAFGDSFSALQRAENSSIAVEISTNNTTWSFSALQRAENSSIAFSEHVRFLKRQCFSALQRAENSSIRVFGCRDQALKECFSALQRAENSSITPARPRSPLRSRVSVLFSEPKIPQCVRRVA